MDISKYIPESIKKIPCHMDFEGQYRAEKMFQIIILLFGVVGFIWGYICQQFSQTVYILLAGFALSCLLTLPPWPMFRRKPLKWQKARPTPEENKESTNTKESTKSKKKK